MKATDPVWAVVKGDFRTERRHLDHCGSALAAAQR